MAQRRTLLKHVSAAAAEQRDSGRTVVAECDWQGVDEHGSARRWAAVISDRLVPPADHIAQRIPGLFGPHADVFRSSRSPADDVIQAGVSGFGPRLNGEDVRIGDDEIFLSLRFPGDFTWTHILLAKAAVGWTLAQQEFDYVY